MSTEVLITADQFAGMSFDVPVELVRGEIVEITNPGGRHGKVCSRACFLLESWAQAQDEFEVVTNDSGVLIARDPDTVRGPDLLIIRRDRLPGGEIPQKHFTVSPDVAIEVKSPSDRWPELIVKVGEFLNAGTGDVWVIDPDHRRVHVFRIDEESTIFDEQQSLASQSLPGFSAMVSEFFRGL
jgi:Uma2 family endonuclease